VPLTNMIDKHKRFDDEVFTYQTTKEGKVFIQWYGKHVAILKGDKAKKFLAEVDGLEEREAQLVMAKVTGNFKRSNER
jgi:hypothetical protein